MTYDNEKIIIDFLKTNNTYYNIDKLKIAERFSIQDYLMAEYCFSLPDFFIKKRIKKTSYTYLISYEPKRCFIIFRYKKKLDNTALRYIGFMAFFILVHNVDIKGALLKFDDIKQTFLRFSNISI